MVGRRWEWLERAWERRSVRAFMRTKLDPPWVRFRPLRTRTNPTLDCSYVYYRGGPGPSGWSLIPERVQSYFALSLRWGTIPVSYSWPIPRTICSSPYSFSPSSPACLLTDWSSWPAGNYLPSFIIGPPGNQKWAGLTGLTGLRKRSAIASFWASISYLPAVFATRPSPLLGLRVT